MWCVACKWGIVECEVPGVKCRVWSVERKIYCGVLSVERRVYSRV